MIKFFLLNIVVVIFMSCYSSGQENDIISIKNKVIHSENALINKVGNTTKERFLLPQDHIRTKQSNRSFSSYLPIPSREWLD